MGTYIQNLEKFERPVKKRGLTITISGLSGSGKNTVAKFVAQALKLKIFSAGDIQRKFAQKKRIPLDKSSIILPKEVDYQMDKTLLKLAIKGGYVLIGRLAGWVAGDWADCRIYVNCQKKIRAKRVAKRDGLILKEALRKISQRDQADRERYWRLYGIDLKRKNIYHLIIDNNKPGLQDLKKQVMRKLKKFFKEKIWKLKQQK